MKNIIKMFTYILIILLVLQVLFRSKPSALAKKENRIEVVVVILETTYNCLFSRGGYVFTLPGCSSYMPGSVLKIVGFENDEFSRDEPLFDTGFFNKKRLVVEQIEEYDQKTLSLEFWLEYLFYIFWLIKKTVLNDFLPLLEVDSSYLVGKLTLGHSQVASKTIDHLFKVTGTQYLASISGFHLNLVVNLMIKLINKFSSRKIVGMVGLSVATLYLLLVGPKISLLRAFIMLLLSIVASSFLFRQKNSIHSLMIVFVLLVINDLTVISSIGFQLTFVATAAIVIFNRVFNDLSTTSRNQRRKQSSLVSLHLGDFGNSLENLKKSKKNKKNSFFNHILNYARDSVKISFYVQILLFPLIIYHFNEFSIVSILVSVALTWLVPGIISLGLFLILISSLIKNRLFLTLLSLPLNFLSEIFISIMSFFDNQLFLIKVAYFPWWYVLIWWLVVALLLKIFFIKKTSSFTLVEALEK